MEVFGNVMDWVLALFLFGLLLFIHELGHFVMARLTGVKVEEFGFGYPPRLIKLFTWQGTLFSINAIPFGGFGRVKGEDGSNMDSDSMNSKPPLQRAFFLAGQSGSAGE